MADAVDSTLIADVARDTVRQVAPQELPRFRATTQAYLEDPERVLEGQKGKDQMLGFGTGQEMTFLTPIVLAMTTQVVRFVAGEVAASLKEESPPVIHKFVRKIFRKLGPDDQKQEKGEVDVESSRASALTPEQLAQVRQIALETARRWNVAEARAALLADSLVGRLAVKPA